MLFLCCDRHQSWARPPRRGREPLKGSIRSICIWSGWSIRDRIIFCFYSVVFNVSMLGFQVKHVWNMLQASRSWPIEGQELKQLVQVPLWTHCPFSPPNKHKKWSSEASVAVFVMWCWFRSIKRVPSHSMASRLRLVRAVNGDGKLALKVKKMRCCTNSDVFSMKTLAVLSSGGRWTFIILHLYHKHPVCRSSVRPIPSRASSSHSPTPRLSPQFTSDSGQKRASFKKARGLV